MGWMYVFLAAFVEIFWVLGLKFSDNLWMWGGTVTALIFSFYFIIRACAVLPSGAVYATFTGSGAAVIAIIDFTLLGEPFTLLKGLFLLLIIVGVVGVQMTTQADGKRLEEASPVKGDGA
ncbi:DMT family transporter [Halomonas halodenitrificans]|uniref:DMT family transporter n=1 Tax=Halomonas halodenitrificans TaxID=28252 RepID=UPI00047FA8BD|nr:SMR family transporter [Halomonas halodenitrificans]